jgi:hypothetical protein
MKVGVNNNGVAWYETSEGEYLLKLYIDSETELTLTLSNATLKDVERIAPEDFFSRPSSAN